MLLNVLDDLVRLRLDPERHSATCSEPLHSMSRIRGLWLRARAALDRPNRASSGNTRCGTSRPSSCSRPTSAHLPSSNLKREVRGRNELGLARAGEDAARPSALPAARRRIGAGAVPLSRCRRPSRRFSRSCTASDSPLAFPAIGFANRDAVGLHRAPDEANRRGCTNSRVLRPTSAAGPGRAVDHFALVRTYCCSLVQLSSRRAST